MTAGIELERRFEVLLNQTGITFSREPSIECPKPVKDKNGEWKKIKTTPDFLIPEDVKPEDGILIEVTGGSGCSDHKRAQRRVINAVGLGENYLVVSGRIIATAEGIENLKDKKKYLRRKLGLNKL